MHTPKNRRISFNYMRADAGYGDNIAISIISLVTILLAIHMVAQSLPLTLALQLTGLVGVRLKNVIGP